MSRTDHLDACLQRERRKHHASVEDLRALLARHGIKMDAATFASMSVSSIHLEWRCFSYNEAIRLGVVYG